MRAAGCCWPRITGRGYSDPRCRTVRRPTRHSRASLPIPFATRPASLAVSAGANLKAVQRMLGHAKASMTLDVYADLFDDDLDVVADQLDTAIKSTADSLRTGSGK